MEDQSTYPALLAAETIPLPLANQSPEPDGKVAPGASTGPGLALKLGALALAIWLLRRWW